jgi:hypothetical protein
MIEASQGFRSIDPFRLATALGASDESGHAVRNAEACHLRVVELRPGCYARCGAYSDK